MLHLINGQIQIRPKEITGVASQTVTPIQVKKVLENQKNKEMNKKYLCLGFALVAVIYFANSQKWKGYAYPDKNNLSNVIELGEFKTEDECNAAAINTLRRVSSVSALVHAVVLTRQEKSHSKLEWL